MTTMISVVGAGSVVHAQQLARAKDGKTARVSAVKGAHYVLTEANGGAASGDISVKRVGKNLVIEQEQAGVEAASVIIEDFYRSEGMLVGLGTNGEYVEYLAATGDAAAAMSEGASSLLTLAAGQPAASFQFAEGGSSVFSSALAGVAAVAGGFALSNNGSSKAPPTLVASAFVLEDQLTGAPAVPPAPTISGGAEGAAANEVASNAGNTAAVESNSTAEAEAIGANGSVGAAIAIAALGVDDIPVIDKVMDDKGIIQGVIADGGYTDDETPTIMGKAEPGVKVHVYRGKFVLGIAVTDANGEWSYTPPSGFNSGTHSFTVKYEYADKQTSGYSAPYVITIDKMPPAAPQIIGIWDEEGRITGAVTDQTITDDNRPTITGTAEAHATLIVYDKGKMIGSTTVGADGNWTFTPDTPLAEGLHMLSYSAVDRAGNSSDPTDVTEFFVDSRPEKINIYYADDDAGSATGEVFSGGATDDSTPTLFGTATAGGIVKIYEGSSLLGEVVADVDGTWQFTPLALSEGAHTLHATVTLAAKGESERSKPFNLMVDMTPPDRPSIEQVLDDVGILQGVLEKGAITDDNRPTLIGKAEAGSTVHIYNRSMLLGSVVADASGKWTYTPNAALVDGKHGFTVTSVDAAGNASAASDVFEIVVATVPGKKPTIDSVYDDAGSKTGGLAMGEETDDYRPDISGTAEAGSTVIIMDNGIEIGRVQADAEGAWTFTPHTNLAEGGHKLAAESMDAAGNISALSDSFNFSVAQNGDDYPRHLVAGGPGKISATLIVDTSGSMAGTAIISVKTALQQLAMEYLSAAGGHAVTLTMLTMTYAPPAKFVFSSVTDAGYVNYIAAVNALTGTGGLSYEGAITRAMDSIKADYLAGSGPNQVFILGDAENSLSQATADKWQEMLLNPTGTAVLANPIQSTPISFVPFPHAYDYSFHWLATDKQAIDMPSAEMMPEILLAAVVGDSVGGNLLANDATLIQDGSEYLTQITFEGGTFRISPNNTLVMANVGSNVIGAYDPATGLLAITTENGTLRLYMHASAGHQAGDYTYKSKSNRLYHGENAKEEVFGYLALDGRGVSQSSDLHIVLETVDARHLLSISRLGKGSGVQGDFVTADGSAGREVSGMLSQQLAAGLKVQVSVDGGMTWQDAVTHGKNWTFIDMAVHSSSWIMQVRVTDGVTHGTKVLSQEVTVVDAPAAPTITSIPEAEGIYTGALAQDGSEVTVSLAGTGAKAGDRIHIQWGTSTCDQALTALNIADGSVTLNVPSSVTHSTASYNYDFSVTAQIIDQDGAIGVPSAPYSVVGTYTRALVSDTLQLAPVGDVYTGNGFAVTTTGTMAKTALTASSQAGLTLSDGLQANAAFMLDKPADYISLRLSGADNALGAQIHVFDVDGNLLHQQMVFGDATARHPATFTWTKTGLMDIGSFTVTAMSSSVTLDAFSQYVVTHKADKRDPNLIDILAETFYGSAGSDVVSLSQYAQTYFAQTTAAVHGGSDTDTLKITSANHVLDMTAAGGKISSMEVIDLTGTGNNTLTLNLSDVLRNGGKDIFHTGDAARVQMMVKGNAGDKVNLSDLLTGSVDHGDWLKEAAVVVEGVTYDAYQHSSLGAELLVQQGVTVVVTNSTAVGPAAFGFESAVGAVSGVLASGEEELFTLDATVPCNGTAAAHSADIIYVQSYGYELQNVRDFRLEAN